jgi:hypothetical protein
LSSAFNVSVPQSIVTISRTMCMTINGSDCLQDSIIIAVQFPDNYGNEQSIVSENRNIAVFQSSMVSRGNKQKLR